MKYLFDQVSNKCSEITTKNYSTSFSLGIKVLDKHLQKPIYNIYGFVRLADEIVDSFHDYDKIKLLEKFNKDMYSAINDRISLNPILNSFQETVNHFNIDIKLVEEFMSSMYIDLDKKEHNKSTYDKYIYGSAEAVGLMCLKVFVDGDEKKYQDLKSSAMSLGSAFQKVNFLRDINDDLNNLGRVYFPNIKIEDFDDKEKKLIENNIREDFLKGLNGIRKLPSNARRGVYLAYVYYYALFQKISSVSSSKIFKKRIRINNIYKIILMLISSFKNKFNLI
tara:strand:+ start:2541 stop:3377 length:837 start_codon:yes stop_codon:yes gene_type:complete